MTSAPVILMIADEVVTGFGRTGRAFGIQHRDVAPDLMVVANGMSGGYAPLAGVIASRTVVETIHEGSGLFSCWGRCRKGGEGPLR